MSKSYTGKYPPHINYIYQDDDGWWASYEDGYCSSSNPECHCEREDTKKLLFESINPVKCSCICCSKIWSKDV